LRPLPGVERPAFAPVIPADQNEFVLIDGGATPECKPIHLVQFAIMGSIYAKSILGRPNPRVGILSNGTEDIKGTELTREAARLCQLLDLNFIGYVEGHDLFANKVDVVVTDGFIGNILLKTIESMGMGLLRLLKRELTATPLRKLGASIARGAFMSVRKRMDPDTYGGAPLLGLNGHVIKAHGSARATAIKNALHFATEAIQNQISQQIAREIAQANEKLAVPA
jgi:glycerol-3-phosphate acyltransferase PlsX